MPKDGPLTQKTVKEYWAQTLDENMQRLRDSLLEAADATRTVWLECDYCHRKSPVEVPDARARTDATKALHQLAGEIPKADRDGSSGGAGFTLKRVIVMPDGRELELVAAEIAPREAP